LETQKDAEQFIDKHPSADLFWVNVHAELDQLVLLQRDLGTSCTATTWKTPAKAGLIARKDLQDIRREVRDHVNRFISDYLVVNQSNLQKYEEHRKKESSSGQAKTALETYKASVASYLLPRQYRELHTEPTRVQRTINHPNIVR
jgi:hypothetical protein